MEKDNIKNIKPTLPSKKFKTILADPPWDIQQKGNYGAVKHYNLMTLERIKAMPVADLADENAHCYLWVTNAAIFAGKEVLEAWGFKFGSIVCWQKFRLGLGMKFRNCNEHILFGTRGKAPVLCNSQPNLITGPVLKHSQKPTEQYVVIERMSPGPYLELFARRRQPKWSVWGNEIESDVVIPGYPVPHYSKTINTESEAV